MRQGDEQDQPHIGDGCFGVQKRLQRKRENDRCPPPDFSPAKARTPGEDRQCHERGRDRRWKTGGKIILPEDFETSYLRPVGEGRLIETKMVVEIRNDVIAAL